MAEKAMTSLVRLDPSVTELTSALKIPIDPDAAPVSLEERSRSCSSRTVSSAPHREALTETLQSELRTRSYIFQHPAARQGHRGPPPRLPKLDRLPQPLQRGLGRSVQALIDAVIARYDIPQRYTG